MREEPRVAEEGRMFCWSPRYRAGGDKIDGNRSPALSHCGSHGLASEVARRGGRRATRAAEGKACRQFFAPFGDLDVPKGFAKNRDTIEIIRHVFTMQKQ